MDETRLKELIADYYVNKDRLKDFEKTMNAFGTIQASSFELKTQSAKVNDPTLARVLERDAHQRKVSKVRQKVLVVDAFVTYLKRARKRDLARLVEHKKNHRSIRSFSQQNKIGMDKLCDDYRQALTRFCEKQQLLESAI